MATEKERLVHQSHSIQIRARKRAVVRQLTAQDGDGLAERKRSYTASSGRRQAQVLAPRDFSQRSSHCSTPATRQTRTSKRQTSKVISFMPSDGSAMAFNRLSYSKCSLLDSLSWMRTRDNGCVCIFLRKSGPFPF